MKLEQIGAGEAQDIYNVNEKELLIMILKRLERMERTLDRKIEDAIKERLKLTG